MNKKILLFILLQMSVFSANAAISTIYFGNADGTRLDLNTPIPASDQAVIFGANGDDLSSAAPLLLDFNNMIEGSDVLATFTLNRSTGFGDDFALTFMGADLNSALTINKSDFTITGVNATYQLVLGALGTGAFTVDMAGIILENSTSFTFRVDTPAAVPVPAAVWLFGSALVGLVTVGRRRGKQLVS